MAKKHDKKMEKEAKQHLEEKKYMEILAYINGHGTDRLHPPGYLSKNLLIRCWPMLNELW